MYTQFLIFLRELDCLQIRVSLSIFNCLQSFNLLEPQLSFVILAFFLDAQLLFFKPYARLL